MLKLIIEFNEKADFSEVGGKGINLLKLYASGFNVPNGFIITTKAYNLFIEENELDNFIAESIKISKLSSIEELEKLSTKIRSKFDEYTLPTQLKNEILTKYRLLKTEIVAVRSSATAEDLAGLSFAGQHDTFLNIKSEKQLENAVVQCFSSLWTARAIQYRDKNNIEQLEVYNAVVVQTMIQSETSGVIFTANPLTGNRTEVVIEAIHGLGEALVSGMVEPDHYVIDEFNKIKTRIGNQKKSIISKSDGGVQVENINSSNKTLEDNMIIKLTNIAREIGKYYGTPQDIEWGIVDDIIYILQSRSITTLFPLPENMSENGLRMYFSINMLQGVLTPFTTLGADAMMRFMFSVGNTFQFDNQTSFEDQSVIGLSANRLWVDMTTMLKNKIGRKILFGFFPLAEPESMKIFNEQIELERFPINHKRNIKTIQQMLHDGIFFGNRIKQIMKNPDNMRIEAKRKSNKFVKWIEKNKNKRRSINEKLDFIEYALLSIPRFLFLDLAPFISVGMMTLKAVENITHPENYNIDTLELFRSIAHNVTTQMNLYLWKCSNIIKSDKKSMELFERKSNVEITNLYIKRELPKIAEEQIDKFMKLYGFRGYSEIDLGQPRWKEEPEPIISHIKTYISITDEKHYPDYLFKKGVKTSERHYKFLLKEILKDSKKGKYKGSVLNFMISRNRKVMGLREYPKFIWIKSITLIREMFIDIGQELVNENKLSDKMDIFFLKINDIRESLNLKNKVIINKETYDRELRRSNMPRVILSNGEVFYNAKPDKSLKEGTFIGSPVSPGIVEAKARVVMKPDEGILEPGEILVCPATDPSWTPLFNIASGLVMEVGGMMTHGSVVAREHGIPGIVSVPNCTTKIKSGQLLRINGATGFIEIIKDN